MHAVFNVLAPMICHIWFLLRINEHCFIARDFIAKDEMFDFIPLTFILTSTHAKPTHSLVLSVDRLHFLQFYFPNNFLVSPVYLEY